MISCITPVKHESNQVISHYRNAFKEALCGVRNRDDLAMYRSSIHGNHSTHSTNVSRCQRNHHHASRNGTTQLKSNGQISPPDRPSTSNGNLLSIETIEVSEKI